MRIAVLSDTHGMLRPEAVTAIENSDAILHGGDIGHPDILPFLAERAPTYAVRGNIDTAAWTKEIPYHLTLEFAGKKVHMVHKITDLAVDPVAEGISVVVFGHSHKPALEEKDGVLYLNPGAAGKRRFSLPISVAFINIEGDDMRIEFLNLLDDAPLP